MSMDNSSLPPSSPEPEGESDLESRPRVTDFDQPISAIRSTTGGVGSPGPEGESDFEGRPRVTDFEQPISANRSTVRGPRSPGKKDEDSSYNHFSPFIEPGSEGTPGSNISTPRLNRFGRMTMDSHDLRPPIGSPPPSLFGLSTPGASSADEDSSDSDEELLPPKPKRRRRSGAIPFKSISPRAPTSIASSTTATIKGDSVEPEPNLLQAPPNYNISTIDNASSAAAIAASGIISAADFNRAIFGAAQVLNYRGPRNPISRHMKFSEEETSSDEIVDGDKNLRVRVKGKKTMWTDAWWSELHEVNGVKMKAGEKGNNLVKDKNKALGGDKLG